MKTISAVTTVQMGKRTFKEANEGLVGVAMVDAPTTLDKTVRTYFIK